VAKKNTREGLCKDYLATVKAKKLIEASPSCVFMIE
jgi:hypothetical protein